MPVDALHQVRKLEDIELTKISRTIMRLRTRDVDAWCRKQGYDRADVEQEITMLLLTYIHSNKYEEHCQRKQALGQEPARYTTCLFSYGVSAFHRIQRQERVEPVTSLDAPVGSDEATSLGELIGARETAITSSPQEVISLLRQGQHTLDEDELWTWWESVFELDGGDSGVLGEDVWERVFSLPYEKLAPLVLTTVLGIDPPTLAEVSNKTGVVIGQLVADAKREMSEGHRKTTTTTPPQPAEVFATLCETMQGDLFGEVDARDWVTRLEGMISPVYEVLTF